MMDSWFFRCPACGRGTSHPAPPAGPSKPVCGAHVNAVTMEPVMVMPELRAYLEARREEHRAVGAVEHVDALDEVLDDLFRRPGGNP